MVYALVRVRVASKDKLEEGLGIELGSLGIAVLDVAVLIVTVINR